MDVTLYNNAGCSLDLSSSVMDRALFHIDNCYRRVSDVPCVNLPRSQAATARGGRLWDIKRRKPMHRERKSNVNSRAHAPPTTSRQFPPPSSTLTLSSKAIAYVRPSEGVYGQLAVRRGCLAGFSELAVLYPFPPNPKRKYLIKDDSHPTFLFAPQIVERAHG